MGCCCHEKNYFLETDLPIQASAQKVSLSPSNRLSTSKGEEAQREEEALRGEEELRQSPVLGEMGQEVWEALAEGEEAEGDLLRVTHANNLPVGVENGVRKRAENLVLPSELHYTCPQPRVLPPQPRQAASYPVVPKIAFAALSTIKEEESSLNDTHRRSVNQISVSDCSQRGEMRRVF